MLLYLEKDSVLKSGICFFQGRIFSAHKRMLARWRTELGCLVNGEGDLSEDEGIFSPEVASSCSSRDTGPGSIAELLSDDDHNSVISISLDSNTSNVKDHTGKTFCRWFRAVVYKLWFIKLLLVYEVCQRVCVEETKHNLRFLYDVRVKVSLTRNKVMWPFCPSICMSTLHCLSPLLGHNGIQHPTGMGSNKSYC